MKCQIVQIFVEVDAAVGVHIRACKSCLHISGGGWRIAFCSTDDLQQPIELQRTKRSDACNV